MRLFPVYPWHLCPWRILSLGLSENEVHVSGKSCWWHVANSNLMAAGVDERVHGQYGGRAGMLKDMELLRDGGKLVELVRRLLDAGMDVYITADHGNTPCVGRGRVTGTGVETETKGKRMYVANDLADVSALQDKYELIECPAAFLPLGLKYYVCPSGVSFDNPGEHVMSHGGMSIDEVVVPFISIRSESA